MLFSPATFRPVRRTFVYLLPCLLLIISVLVSRVAAQTSSGELDRSFQNELLIGLDGTIRAVVPQPNGKILIGGDFTFVNGESRSRVARLNADGTLDPTFDPPGGADSSVYSLALQPDGKILVGGWFWTVNGESRSRIARLNADGTLDPTFVSHTDHIVDAITLQADGKILIGGHFTFVNGESRSRIARLNADGTLDLTFDPPGGANNTVYSLALQVDGKILIGGAFWTINGISQNGIARLNQDGTLDTAFASTTNTYSSVHALALQPDGKVVIGGNFWSINGASRGRIARLNADGTLDTTFNLSRSVDDTIYSLVLQPDGKIVAGGTFWTFNGVNYGGIAHLNTDGSLSATAPPTFVLDGAPYGTIGALALQADGKIVVGGDFTSVNNTRRTYITRLNQDSSLDTAFTVRIDYEISVWALALQQDGKILIGGKFIIADDAGHHYQGVARLNANGTIDPTFAPSVDAENGVWAIAVQLDGKILIGGYFNTVNGEQHTGLARLNVDGSLDPSFASNQGVSGGVFAFGLQTDGKIIIGGYFSTVNGEQRNNIARLNADGTLDSTFAALDGTNRIIRSLAVQPDGKIVVGGDFTSVNGVSQNGIARLNDDGTLDSAFASSIGYGDVYVLELQPDGKIVIGGAFWSINGEQRNNIARLNADGTLDSSFNPPGGTNSTVAALMVQPDRKIIIGGNFSTVNGEQRNNIARLNADGTLDPTFTLIDGVNNPVDALALQPDGKIVIGGWFSTINGVVRNGLARLHNTLEPAGLFLSPATTAIGQGQTFQLDLQFDMMGREADTVDAYLTFDAEVLEVIDEVGDPATGITPNLDVVGSVTYNHVDQTSGEIAFSASQYDTPYLTGMATVATIRFRAKAPMDSTQVQLLRSGLRQSDLFKGGTRLQATLRHATMQLLNAPVLYGRIAVEERGPSGTPSWITPLFHTEGSTTTGGITLYQPGTTTQVGHFTAITDADGRFSSVLTNVPIGTYDIRVKGANTLSNQRANVNLASIFEVDFGTLRVGDSTGDDGVTGADVSYLIPSFWLYAGDAGFRPYADTNRDDGITGADVSALVPNFLRTGPIAVMGTAQPQPREMREQSSTPPQITLSPAKQKVQVGEIVPVELKIDLGTTLADTVDLHIKVDPALLEIVDASGQPVRSLTVNRSAFGDVTYNRVDGAKGQISVSASRLTAPAATGSLTIATFYVQAKQRFTTTPLTIATSGTRRADLFAGGQSLQPTFTGSILTIGNGYRIYIPRASQ